MAGLDVFESDGFSMFSLTRALEDRPHVPMRLGELGIFEARGVRTTKVWVEKQGSTLQLVSTTERNAPRVSATKAGRDMIPIPTHRIALEDAVTADEVQGIRAFGSETELKQLEEEVNQKSGDMSDSLTATEEYHRLGAVKGQVLDADGSTLLDQGTVFGVTLQSERGDVTNAAENGLRNAIAQQIIRPIEDELGGLTYSGVHVMCSSEFFDAIASHPDWQNRLKGFPEGARELTARMARRRIIDFGGAMFEEYRGNVGGTPYVAANKAHAFPVGVSGLFLSRYAPAEWFDTVNTMGRPRYVRTLADPEEPDARRRLIVQTQVAHFCTRPRTLIPLKVGAT